MVGMRHFYHVSPSGSTPHRSSLGYAHPPPSPWSQGDFTKPENEKSYTIEFSRVEPLPGTRWLHADGETKDDHPQRVVISFGPEHAPLEQRQVALAIELAFRTLS